MTNQQGAPEALRLADWLQNAVATYPQVSEDEPGGYCQEVDQVMDEAAAELRRLHAENERLAALIKAQQPAPSAAGAVSDEDEALDLLATLFDAWESGTPCYEEPESSDGFLGHAFRLDDEVFHRCADLLNRRRGKQPAPTPQADSAPLAAPADIVVLEAALRAIHQAIDLIGEPDTERLRTVRRVLRGAVVVAEDSTAPQADSQPDDKDLVAVPRDLIGAACSAIDKKRDGAKTLAELRRYTIGDLSIAIASAPQADSQPAPEYVGNGMFKGETIQKAAEHWANWCDVRSIGGVAEFLRFVAKQADSQPAPVVGRMSPSKEWLETRLTIADDSGVQAGVPPKNARPCDAPPGCNSHNCLECNDYPRAARAPGSQPAPEYVGNGMFKGETIEKAAEHWANWCDRRCMTGLSEFLRVVAARAPADSVMLDDGKTIQMTNLTKSLQDGNWNVEYWRGYGFTANNRTTTNGSLSFLLRCVNTPENQAAVMQFAREVAKIDQDAARQVARIDAANAARKQGANHD